MEENGVGGEGERNEKKIHPQSRFHHITVEENYTTMVASIFLKRNGKSATFDMGTSFFLFLSAFTFLYTIYFQECVKPSDDKRSPPVLPSLWSITNLNRRLLSYSISSFSILCAEKNPFPFHSTRCCCSRARKKETPAKVLLVA